ncbi:GNAT family N-acyltransferase [Stutzerimonas sp. NM35]
MGHLQAERLQAEESLREAQTPCYRVFSSEYNAQLQEAEAKLDNDDLDSHCSHIAVRDWQRRARRHKALGLSVTEWNARRMDPRRLRVDDIGARPDIIQTTRLSIPRGRDEHLPYRFVDAGFAPHCTRNPLRRSQCEGKDYVLLQRDKLSS